MKLNEAVAIRVSKLLDKNNMTKHQLCKKLAMSQVTLKHILDEDYKSLRLDTVILLAEGFDMSIQEFFNDDLFKRENLDIDWFFEEGEMESFIEVLKELIDEKGLSLRQIAQESGVSAMQLSRYLNGSTPTIDITLKLAVYFDCSLDYLFGLSQERGEGKYKTTEYDMSKFLYNYQKLLKENNLSNYKFMKESNFDESVVRHWKAGSTPRLNIIYYIAYNLGGSIDRLIERKR